MAGSYQHAVTQTGKLRSNESFVDMIENLGDAYEMAVEMYSMIWLLADGDAEKVKRAAANFRDGLEKSPGIQNYRPRRQQGKPLLPWEVRR